MSLLILVHLVLSTFCIPTLHFQVSQQSFLSRSLSSQTRQPIRISLNIENLTSSHHKIFDICRSFFSKRLKVTPINFSIKAPKICVDVNPPKKDLELGIQESDLHVYILEKELKDQSFAATGKSCSYASGEGSYPDWKFTRGRPVMGRIIYNTASKPLTQDTFASITSSIIHQFIHILGFDIILFDKFLDIQTGSPYSYQLVEQVTYNSQRGKTLLLKTPLATEWARKHFGCDRISGVQIQNEGSDSSKGSHWERTVFYDEIMTATTLGTVKVLSGLTFQLLRDMGWYEVNGFWNDTFEYGQGKGCEFYEQACYSQQQFEEYCQLQEQNGSLKAKQICSPDRYKRSMCMKKGTFSDGCGIAVPFQQCHLQNPNSMCFYSTLKPSLVTHIQHTQCLPYQCISSPSGFSLEINASSRNITCYLGEKQKTYYGVFGILTCPNVTQVCEKKQSTCQNWCSHNGFCMGGVCNCLQGYSGKDCSQNICKTQEVNFNNVCVKMCPLQYFVNIFDRTCSLCSEGCLSCYDLPDNCSNCSGSFSLYQNKCLQNCPKGYFNINSTCKVCSPNCIECVQNAENCTICFEGLYLFKGNCINITQNQTFISLKLFIDTVNHKVVAECPVQLITQNNTCVQCSKGLVKSKLFGNCVSKCEQGTYHNSSSELALPFCLPCSQNCRTCSSPLICLSCKTNSTYRYLQSHTCVQSCSIGHYLRQRTCHPCNRTCRKCNSSKICFKCKAGFYLQNQKCVATCFHDSFGNNLTWRCEKCSQNCINCTAFGCLACFNGYYLIQTDNQTVCVWSCPDGFYRSKSQCRQCYASCKTCNSGGRQSCKSCQNNYLMRGNTCYKTCPLKTFQSNGQCKPCPINCLECDGKGKCIKCWDWAVVSENGECVQKAPERKCQQTCALFGNEIKHFAAFLLVYLVTI